MLTMLFMRYRICDIYQNTPVGVHGLNALWVENYPCLAIPRQARDDKRN